MNNKKGVKLLATIAVFAMVAAALVVALPASDVDADPSLGDKYDANRDGPLNFADVGTIMSGFDNITLGNQIEVSYDEDSMTYYVTGILAKQDVSETAKTEFKALWPDNTKYLYGLAFSFNGTGTNTIKVGNGDAKTVTDNEGCLLYIKETKISTFTVSGTPDVVYSIDFTGVTLVDDVKNNPTKAYVSIPNADALVGKTVDSGIDGNGGKWSINGGVLTLTNYNGKEYFSGDITMVVLEGQNTITLTGAPCAIQTDSELTIKSIDGVGSLSINMDSEKDATAISSGKLIITGVGIDITMTERYDATAEKKVWLNTVGIASAGLDIYAASLTIDVAKDNYYSACGINSSAAVDIKSTPIKIAAGERGMNVGGNIAIADSDIEIEADLLGIRAHANGASVSITKESNVTLAVNGLKGGYDRAYGLSASGKIEVQSDSVLDTEGMILYGNNNATTSINNATIINNGEMLVYYTAKFQNAGKFVNNGTVGIYGDFINSAGETSNKGVMNTYAQYRIGMSASLATKDATQILTVKIDSIMPLADGTFLADMVVSTDKDTTGKACVGTLAFTSAGYTIDALTESGMLSVIYTKDVEKNKYAVFSSDYTFTNTSDPEEKDDTILTALINLKNDATISVTGGQLTNDGSIAINTDSKTLVTGGKLVNNGNLAINADITTTGGTLSGEGAVVAANVEIVLAGTIDMVFTHTGTYTPTATTTVPNPAPVEFTDAVSVVGKVDGVTINTTPVGSMDGFIAITGMNQAENDGKAVVTVLQGSATFEGEVETDMVLAVASGATLQILNKGAESTKGVVAIQDGATINMKVTTDRNTFKFGELKYTIKFQNEGYTYYGSLQYALANAAEGATLDLSSAAEITTDTVVKKGITLVFADKATLTITGKEEKKIAVSMDEGATFVLGKESTVTFNQYATVSGTIIYDGNEIILDKVVLDSEHSTSASIVGKAAGASTPSYIDVSIDAVDGKIGVAMGTVKGAVAIHKVMDGEKLKTTAKLTVAEGAVAEITFADTKYAETVINGTLTLSAATDVNGTITGAGSVVLKDTVAITLKNTASASITIGNGTDAFVLDKATAAYFNKDGKYIADDDKVITIVAVAKTGTKAAFVAIYGEILSGTVTSQGNTAFGNASSIFTLGTDAVSVVPKDATLTIVRIGDDTVSAQAKNQNTANGLLKVAGTINMKVANVSETASYGTLNYQITYTDGEYTVYTMLATGVNSASAGDSFTISKDLEIEKKMEIPAGVSIVVADDVVLTVKTGAYITIGTPITTVGATSSIQGTIKLEEKAFVIVYADDTVDMSNAKILDKNKVAAKNSQFTVLYEVYATVYADTTDAAGTYNEVVKVLVPDIDGYRFLGWTPLTTSTFGSTDYEANMKADMVKVTFQKVDGISYYVENVKQYTVGAPVYVAYGATVTAVADAGYTGNALVNGKSYITIDSTTTTIVGSGVSPAVDPTPEPEPEKDDGMALTDILLIVLVILAAILVIVVAIRMMRS